MEKKHPIGDYTDGPTLCKLEQNTEDALDRGLMVSTGDEGYAAWVQYREIQKAKKKAGKPSVGPSLIGVGHSGVPLPFKVKGGQRILCLDGGGVRGLVQIEILRQIEEATGKRIPELFDWIVGTSTGGIIALAMVYGELAEGLVYELLVSDWFPSVPLPTGWHPQVLHILSPCGYLNRLLFHPPAKLL